MILMWKMLFNLKSQKNAIDSQFLFTIKDKQTKTKGF